MGNKGYHKLIVWKKAHELVLKIYRLTRNFPPEEKFGLISQMRRSALSVASNIVEGHSRRSKKAFLNFLDISNASLVETEYHLEVAKDLSYLSKDEYEDVEVLRNEVGALLNSFMRTLRSK